MKYENYSKERPCQGQTKPNARSYTGKEVDKLMRISLEFRNRVAEMQIALLGRTNLDINPEALALMNKRINGEHVNALPPGSEYSLWYELAFKKIRRYLGVHFRPTTIEEYESWLRGYLLKGGTVKQQNNESFYSDMTPLFTATKDFSFKKHLYGADSVSLLIPKGIHFDGPGGQKIEGDRTAFGHSSIFVMDGYRVLGHAIDNVKTYADIHPRILITS